MASSDAFQRDATSDASQLGGSPRPREVSRSRIGSFNVGVFQDMLTGRKFKFYLREVEDIITTCVQDAQLDIMNLCEFGGHLQGLSAAGLDARDMKIFKGPAAPYR